MQPGGLRWCALGVIAGVLVVGCGGSQSNVRNMPARALSRSGWSGTQIDASTPIIVTSLSCSGNSFCVGVDRTTGEATVWNGSQWAQPTAIETGNHVTAVSCASSTNCQAVDDRGNAIAWNGTSWATPTLIDKGVPQSVSEPELRPGCTNVQLCAQPAQPKLSANATSPTTPSLTAISCTEIDFCVATDNEGDAVTYSSGVWSAAVPVDFNADAISSLSCVFDQSCVAVDGVGNALVWNGLSWNEPKKVDGSSDITSVSCASTYLCVAVDGDGNAITHTGPNWSAPVSIDPGNRLTAISCPSSTSCLAVDSAGNQLIWDGTSWSAPSSISSGAINALSCTSATDCQATDSQGDALQGAA